MTDEAESRPKKHNSCPDIYIEVSHEQMSEYNQQRWELMRAWVRGALSHDEYEEAWMTVYPDDKTCFPEGHFDDPVDAAKLSGLKKLDRENSLWTAADYLVGTAALVKLPEIPASAGSEEERRKSALREAFLSSADYKDFSLYREETKDISKKAFKMLLLD